MARHYINTNGIRGTAMGGVLLDIDVITTVGSYWPATPQESAYFDVLLDDGRTMKVVFDSSIPVARQMEEHARLVKEIVKKFGLTGEGEPSGVSDGRKTIKDIQFEPVAKTFYDATDPDGALLLTARGLGAYTAYLYSIDAESEHHRGIIDASIRHIEQFAVKVFGDSMAMDEFGKARDTTTWSVADDDPGRVVSPEFGKKVDW
jgi:hypothetical protein